MTVAHHRGTPQLSCATLALAAQSLAVSGQGIPVACRSFDILARFAMYLIIAHQCNMQA